MTSLVVESCLLEMKTCASSARLRGDPPSPPSAGEQLDSVVSSTFTDASSEAIVLVVSSLYPFTLHRLRFVKVHLRMFHIGNYDNIQCSKFADSALCVLGDVPLYRSKSTFIHRNQHNFIPSQRRMHYVHGTSNRLYGIPTIDSRWRERGKNRRHRYIAWMMEQCCLVPLGSGSRVCTHRTACWVHGSRK